MKRREALKKAVLLTGGALSPSIVSAVLSGITVGSSGKKWVPKIVNPEQNDLITDIAELIIPETDTPGAKAAKVNEFIDLMLADWFTVAERNHFFKGLTDLDARAEKKYSTRFVECEIEDQTTILKKLEKDTLSHRNYNAPGDNQNSILKPFFDQVKELTLTGYYTSEIGATQELKYYVATNNYDGCIPFDKIGRAWSE
tara:strand:+ start:61 stop:657 length:597 start_codon:yes stop_codon:yes gene_type:complete